MINKMTIREAIEYIKNDESNDDFSFRGDDFTPEITFDNSRYHGDEEEEFELAGVSAIKVTAYSEKYIKDAARTAGRYGKNVFLLRGLAVNAHAWANDPGECLMQAHQIVAVISD